MEISGAEIFVKSLQKLKVDLIFGYPGGVVLPVFDALYKNPKLRHMLVRHEQGAVHMADGYARATGKVGVALVTSGPGATNTVTGIATAFMDSIPIVVFTGQVPTALIGNDAFQEADIVGITRPCVKHSYLVKDVKDLAQTIAEAFYIASSGKPGPVLVDLPKDVATNETKFVFPDKVKLRSYKPNKEGHTKQIEKLAKLMGEAIKPVFYVGGGVISSNASVELRKLVRHTHIPITETLMGLGSFPSDNKLNLGMLGMHGTYRANMAITHSDLIIALGSRFDDRVTGKLDEFAPNAKIAHVDIDPSSISKNVKVDIPVVGDLPDVLSKLNAVIKTNHVKWKEKNEEWLNQIKKWKDANKLGYKTKKNVIKPQFVVEEIMRVTKGDGIYATEVGQNQMWAAQYLRLKNPRTFLTSGGLGTMGYGFPAAIGAQAAFPDKVVIDIAGDGSIQMNIQELGTATQYRLPVIIVILNNGFLGMVRQWQQLFYGGRYSHSCTEFQPDFVKLAESYGAYGERVTKPEEVGPALERAIEGKIPAIIDCVVEREENVYPMVPAGAPINKMLLA
ncbi:MAG TPA: biosynthetic-type acetolactate synthase large subunit [Nitrospinota bacterium]|nr:biosynthetic-type acetolactate synthase large subunit [Nitrospinota bacterium]|tara:strand:+ start:10547 stop:12235 length:1689 start_codon:yes stop_codon:yes gene_type:complete